MKKICMVVPDPIVKGGIASVVNGYRGSMLEKEYSIIYVESYVDGSKFAKLMKGVASYFHYIKVLLFDHPNIIHIHSSFGASFYRKLFFIYLASWMKIPIVNHIHGADFNTFFNKASHRKQDFIKKIYNKCSVLIALSEEWKEHLSYIISPKSIHIVENYSTLHEDAYLEKLKRTCNNNVLFLGELGMRKGCFDIPEVVAYVSKEIPDVKFIMAGSGSLDDKEKIQSILAKYGVLEHVIFPGWVRGKEKDKLLREADLFILPSYNEGMPMSILDAMGYGLPIVSTNVGGIPKLIDQNGSICNPGDKKAMAEAIVGLLIDNDNRAKAGWISLEKVKAKYTLDAHLSLLMEIYNNVI